MAKKLLTKEKVIEVAQNEVGYLEKRTNANLYSKTKNAGSNNYTKYGKWFNLNGAYWCAIFICWIFYKAFGYENGKKLLCGAYNAACESIRQNFIKAGRYYPADGKYVPEPGDIIFYWTTVTTRSDHIGIVERVPVGYVNPIEGNTSGANGVVWNGGGVARKSYRQDFNKILGYGKPDYQVTPLTVPNVVLHKGDCGGAVKQLQACLNEVLKYNLEVDGEYGDLTAKAIKQFKVIYELDNKNGDIYGKKMRKALNRELRAMESKQD